AIGGDSDGLVVPYNKKVHKQFGEFAGFASKWAQTFVAQGEGLAGVVLYAAVGGAQPPLHRQRLKVALHKDNSGGEIVGIPKIAIGNGNYTGDASWGIFGTVFAPGEVPLEKGKTYAIVFETMESKETIGNFVNIKGDRSDGRAGFNPYKKHPSDDYPHGGAFLNGVREMDFDLDMQIIEYDRDTSNSKIIQKNLVRNGDFQSGVEPFNLQEILSETSIPPRGSSGFIKYNKAYKREPQDWKTIKLTATTKIATYVELPSVTNFVARIYGEAGTDIDGVLVQKVEGLSRHETYMMRCLVRSSRALDRENVTMVGYDPTGQDIDGNAKTIIWTNLPSIHSQFLVVQTQAIRPKSDSISIWLRGKSTFKGDTYAPFYADFDDVRLLEIKRELNNSE
ncbi:MAG: hypothetical protein N2487_02425, partial [Verrucomicrobiae bacterium]|nr:hypothetical protein [Verrucomicrobiae bacterium]